MTGAQQKAVEYFKKCNRGSDVSAVERNNGEVFVFISKYETNSVLVDGKILNEKGANVFAKKLKVSIGAFMKEGNTEALLSDKLEDARQKYLEHITKENDELSMD